MTAAQVSLLSFEWIPTDADVSFRARYRLAGAAFQAALVRFGALTLKYADDQPRVPAGSPDGGQWTSGGPAAAEQIADPFSAFLGDLPALLLAGGGGALKR